MIPEWRVDRGICTKMLRLAGGGYEGMASRYAGGHALHPSFRHVTMLRITAPTWNWCRNAFFWCHGVRFEIEFAFRDARQHLGLNHGQARSQAKLHFHFNIVFVALFRVRLQARLQADRPPRPLFPAPTQAPQFRGGNTHTLCRPVGDGPKRRQSGIRPPLDPAGTPVAARTPSRIRAGWPSNRPDTPAQASKCA